MRLPVIELSDGSYLPENNAILFHIDSVRPRDVSARDVSATQCGTRDMLLRVGGWCIRRRRGWGGGAWVLACLALFACASTALDPNPIVRPDAGGTDPGRHDAGNQGAAPAAPFLPAGPIRYVFVIAFENHDDASIYGNHVDAPYLNDALMPQAAIALDFNDEFDIPVPSEPHYVWLVAGTNTFDDHVFATNADASELNSTASHAHLVGQLNAAGRGAQWRSYQEDINAQTGACPIAADGFYAPKHNPFVFFQDVSGSPPSKDNADCAAHYRPYDRFQGDLVAGDVATFTFITPNQCHDMHGQAGCPNPNGIAAGDAWLQSELPSLLAFAQHNDGVIFLVWDEGDQTRKLPFIALGPTINPGYASPLPFDHSSVLRTIEAILGLPPLPTVEHAHDLRDLFR